MFCSFTNKNFSSILIVICKHFVAATGFDATHFFSLSIIFRNMLLRLRKLKLRIYINF